MIRRIRLISGLTMLAYVTMHLLNHALGLVSVDGLGAGANRRPAVVAAADAGGIDPVGARSSEIEIRGKQEKLSVAVFAAAGELAEIEGAEPAET